MKTVATLGPEGTYSDIAAKQYQQTCGESVSIFHYPSINQALNAVGHDCDLAVLPIENFSEGFVSLVLDHIIDSDLSIISEIILPIQFACVANTHDLGSINKLWVQFVARGQCSEFIDSLLTQHNNPDGAVSQENNVRSEDTNSHINSHSFDLNVISTETNMVSHQQLLASDEPAAAIVPAKSFSLESFEHVIDNVNDFKNNQTRFLVLAHSRHESHLSMHTKTEPNSNTPIHWKSSLVILDDHDRPGLLAEILTSFAKRKVNLTSIVSRPTKVLFGTYNFLIDIVGHVEEPNVAEAIFEIKSMCVVKELGSYPAAKIRAIAEV